MKNMNPEFSEARIHIQKITLTIFNISAFFSYDFSGAD